MYSDQEIVEFVKANYDLSVESKPLPGELDHNFFLTEKSGLCYILKVANKQEKQANLELQNAIIDHLNSKQTGLQVSRLVRSIRGENILRINGHGNESRMVRLLTWVEGRVFAKANPHSPLLLYRLGEMCGIVCRSLADFDHTAAHRFMKWDPSQAAWIKPHIELFKGEEKEIVSYFYTLFETNALPHFHDLRKSVNYNDANDYNVLVSHDLKDPFVPSVIDFGDVVYTNTVNELAIAIAYSIMDKPDPLDAACHVVKGFNDSFGLEEKEIAILFPLVATRLIISVTCSILNRTEDPGNEYLQISDRPAWELLKKLKAISPAFAHFAFRTACGLEPCPVNPAFIEWASAHHSEKILPVDTAGQMNWLDLSVGSLDLGNTENLFSADKLNERVSKMMHDSNFHTAIGRYDEVRGFYSTDAFASEGNDGPAWRTVHLGIDFFAAPDTEVRSVLDASVHSYANNNADRDYGPTLILKHKVSDSLSFYTLYGHLSEDSLTRHKKGDELKKGDVIGRIGDRPGNGNWPPHLHFQVILDLLDMNGDFPGVAFPNQRELWKSISPDPWLLLTGKPTPKVDFLSANEILQFRKSHLGKNLSISYRDPLQMVRGFGTYLIDTNGQRFLDTVNNVAHVGHENPRVVAAGQRQMAVLNTNTRYLHENIIRFSRAILDTMPAKLNVVYIVNSGSEANELALRLAKNFTGQKDMIVSEHGYHGNTNACIEISAYKFEGKGGKGAAPHIHVIPMPDSYRGLYRGNDEGTGRKYAGHISDAIRKIHSLGRSTAAFICESVISCGGQVVLPEGFLREAFISIRADGGVCISDEVQTGCGRVGNYFWAFQEHGVVPDIVTIGKPIGNGHPLGVVVTTQEIADAFNNGMEYFNTFGGNPVSCAIGLEVLNVIKDESLQKNAKFVGDYLRKGFRQLLSQFEIIGDVRGPGLFIGVEFVRDRDKKSPATEQAAYLANRMRDKGILMSTDGPDNNVLKIKPPIIFSTANADQLLETFEKVLKEDFMKV